MSKIQTKVLSEFVHDLINNCSGLSKADIISELRSKKMNENIKKYIEEHDIKAKKVKSEEDKNKPSKTKTGYLIFCEHNRVSITKKYPELTNKEIMVKLGEYWNSIKDTDDANKYYELAGKDKLRYEDEMKLFREKYNIPDKVEKPKQPKKAFYLYKDDNYDDFMVANPELSKKDLNSLIQEKWKQLKTDKSDTYKKYIELEDEEKKKFVGADVVVEDEDELVEEEEEVKPKKESKSKPAKESKPKESKKEEKPKESKKDKPKEEKPKKDKKQKTKE